MRDLDETDLEILQLLVVDSRRPYSEIGDEVDLSPPAVSDRIQRLEEVGVIRQFTLDVDHSQLGSGVPILIDLSVEPGTVDDAQTALLAADGVEHVFATVDARLVVHARRPQSDIREWLSDVIDVETVREYSVELLSDAEWSRNVATTGFGLTCAECGNTVTSEGVASRIDGDVYQFCCPSCESQFADRYDDLKSGTEAEP